MSLISLQTDLHDRPALKARQQCAALCYRLKGSKVQVLLITSRGSQRWIIPKGWRVKGKSLSRSAEVEAWEEAGVVGAVRGDALGSFDYVKTEGRKLLIPCTATVFAVKVKSMKTKFPERGQRRLKWFSPKKAAQKVSEPDLAALILGFDPHRL